MAVNVSFLQELLNTVAEQGRALLPRSLFGGASGEEDIEELSRALVSSRGEASGVAIAREILARYRSLTPEERAQYFRFLAETFRPNAERAAEAARAYTDQPSEATLRQLQTAVESPRQEFFRRLNLAPGATSEIVALRRDLLRLPPDDPAAAVDADLRHLLYSWFNRGFLVLRRIDWQTPAAILEKIIAYEAVHEIKGWDDLRRRLDPADRRCFAFFHPSLVDEPLIFVEVALTGEVPETIGAVLDEERKGTSVAADATTAVFYSISNCQDGLKGISFGHFLLKQVIEELVREMPRLKTFVTLSPVPHFARWLDRVLADEDAEGIISPQERERFSVLWDPRWYRRWAEAEALRPPLLALAAHYFLVAKSPDGRPIDPVARFHLGNGAQLERINWLADTSERGLREAHGIMVNYRYVIGEIERNHEAYANAGTVAAAKSVRALLRAPGKARTAAPAKRQLVLPGPEPAAAGRETTDSEQS